MGTTIPAGSGSCPETILVTQTIAVETDHVDFAISTPGIYKFQCQAICGTGCTVVGNTVDILFNDTTTNRRSHGWHASGTSGVPTLTVFANDAKSVVGFEAVAGKTAKFEVTVLVTTAQEKVAFWTCTVLDSSSQSINSFGGAAFWQDATTPVTKITFKDAGGNKFFGVGTIVSGQVTALS